MTRRRRALLLLALALLLGLLAAGSVGRREAALERALGPRASVLVTRAALTAGAPLAEARPVLRLLPRRFVPPDAVASATVLAGARAAVALPAGSYVTAAALRMPGAPGIAVQVGPGERAAQLLAQGDPTAVVPGAHVDVLVTRDGAGERSGATTLALQDVEVLAARRARQPAGEAGDGARVLATLRVSLRQAVYLAAAQSFARELRLLVRAPGDRAEGGSGFSVGARLR